MCLIFSKQTFEYHKKIIFWVFFFEQFSLVTVLYCLYVKATDKQHRILTFKLFEPRAPVFKNVKATKWINLEIVVFVSGPC
jgi:hypothetical protein